ncbi:hypothetical protein BBD42_08510 [Paenibacillus sp. BIHB 4019]|uniref:DUF817 domain-containing protein n=1 Tax=Paenibacillus sp. BIHB 4019 TaxID=1870819 RepID=A0A1B2DFI9_9BACL|nr:hypothetical protein BBD42_08510 [Paenibacillus sp. BIHB 4019]
MIFFLKKLLLFGYLQALNCLFPVTIFGAMALTHYVHVPGIARYDLILLICLAMQAVMVATKLETWDELKVICLFHIIGLALEVYKVKMGSWTYPGEGWSRVFDVPLYSGFMYASVASYICQSWRRLHLEMVGWPKMAYAVAISAAIYLNFFTHHYVWDFRWVLMAGLIIVFWRTSVHFKLGEAVYKMPLTLAFVLIGFFIWIAENIMTFFGAWAYPDQEKQWTLVHVSKISSWLLLVVISIIIVAQLKRVKSAR